MKYLRIGEKKEGVRLAEPPFAATDDDVIDLRIFKELFQLPRAIVYNSVEERAMIWKATGNRGVYGEVVGVGSEVPTSIDAGLFRERCGDHAPYMIYIGRIDQNKGCNTLFNHYRRYREDTGSNLSLVLVGIWLSERQG